jgi:hypothetical protein
MQTIQILDELSEELLQLFASGKEENFEDGVENQFSRDLLSLIDKHGIPIIEKIIGLILDERVEPSVASEALRRIGDIDEPSSRIIRRDLLEICLLEGNSVYIRDGALLGLVSIHDSASIPSVTEWLQQLCPKV